MIINRPFCVLKLIAHLSFYTLLALKAGTLKTEILIFSLV